ncbi:MAG TPA: cupin domain-containing protein [Alphaproteobacteria bacterium]|jgi:predicted cupin superfamily sugar epimerase|nr:cupin domain-containing protein [Alphaproteobacteria bacterium]
MRKPAPAGSAAAVVRALRLKPHPEGGHYRETWRDKAGRDNKANGSSRGSGTAIYYLLARGEESRWHRIDATEIWHYYAGAPLALRIATRGRPRTIRLGPAVARGEQPQAIVPKHAWQSARSTGAWTLVGCTVSPAFEFSGFEMAPEGFTPGRQPARKRRHIAR